ncbi:PKD domain-containing protein [Lutibacter sp. TH_r2]|uniref:PKD domain-containing protein n=1 Tax=Lutibacter sp. TH_r2 TaxID=3082083 RepID=UPI0029535638|nr:PKD domain-containing protein [Lutibacter sp. TH_r2]MDV7186806.1 PKD domain-containing protein [Lutibacter sp. TH_r2]
MKPLFTSIILMFFCVQISAQEIQKDTIPRTADIVYTLNGNQVSLNPDVPPLNQIAGAPKAFYTYYWEFGDGNYSFQEKPIHTYKNKGNYEVKLSVTNNYDDGKPPTTRPKDVSVAEDNIDVSLNEKHNLNSSYGGFRLQTNREPVPEEEIQFLVSYGNDKEYPTSGKIYLFFNEKKYKAKNFELIDTRLYNNEKEISEKVLATNNTSKEELIQTTGISTFLDEKLIVADTLKQNLPLTLEEAKAYYHDFKIYDFDTMEPNEERTMFFTLKTTPEMLKDTSAVISIRSIYVPERGNDSHKVQTKEMEIVTSHDPNKMAVYDTRLNYRLVRFKRLKYRVRFQNDGEGPARLIKLNVDIPEMLDKSSLEVLDMYPKCPICPDEQEVRYSCLDTIISKDQISFQFKNIYLPGTAQKNVHDKDSTKGFVKYSLKFGKDFHKKPSKSKTAIIFDKNEPIITNTSTSRFSPGISIGAKAGYNSFPDLDNSKSYFFGATISPYKSYKKYVQAELMISTHNFSDIENLIQETGRIDVAGAVIDNALLEKETAIDYKKINIDVVPISFRYNLNGVIGLGVGTQISLDISNKSNGTSTSNYFSYFNGEKGDPIDFLNTSEKIDISTSFADINYGIFGDITIGASRIGPSLGARYIYNFNQPHSQLHLYAIWKL